MTTPPLLQLAAAGDYEQHFHEHVCKLPLRTPNGMPVYVPKHTFRHAFFESMQGSKNVFSQARAERMMWIDRTIASASAKRLQGWDSKTRSYAPNMCVFHAFDEFVVVVRISRDTETGKLKGNFVTCYVADRSLNKILSSPPWSYADFLAWE